MSDHESVVSVETLRRVFNEALDSLKERVGETVELDKDFFWAIKPEAKYDTYTPPGEGELMMGQLSESWSNVVRQSKEDISAQPYTLVWIAEVLEALGHQVP